MTGAVFFAIGAIKARWSLGGAPSPWDWRARVTAMGSGIIGQRCMLSDEGVTMLGRRRHHKLHRSGTVIGLKGDCYVVHWDGNAEQTVRPYARRYVKIIQPAPRRG